MAPAMMKLTYHRVMRRLGYLFIAMATVVSFGIIYIGSPPDIHEGKRPSGRYLGNKQPQMNMVPSGDSKGVLEGLGVNDRLTFVQRKCSEARPWFQETQTKVARQQNFLVDDAHRLMVCDLHKVASTQLSGILYDISNDEGERKRYRDKVIRHVSVQEANESPYKKVMFIREPMERLLSGYIANHGAQIIRTLSPTFDLYLRALVSTPIEKIHDHYQRFYEICQPCKIKYDFIGTLSTFDSDVRLIFNRSDFGRMDSKKRSQRAAFDNLKTYYRDIDTSVIKQLWEKFRIDYEIFGYPYPSHLLNASAIH